MSDSVAAAPQSASSPSPRRGRVLRRWVIGLSALLLTLLLLLIVRFQGHVSGHEFSPSHFRQREFSFYEIPLIHLQITPIRRSGSTPATALYIRQSSLIKTPTGTPADWQLVSISRGITGTTPADPQLLIDQMKLQQGGDYYWKQWSIDHAKNATVFWPIIQELAKRELYIVMPSIFELAQADLEPSELTAQIDTLLKDEYFALVKDMDAADRGELAQQLLAEALSDYPNDVRLQSLRQTIQPAADSAAENPGKP